MSSDQTDCGGSKKLNSSQSWICDGVSRNGKPYPDCSGPHEPYENQGTDCIICGLPKEAVIQGRDSKQLPLSRLKKVLVRFGLLVIILVLGGGLVVSQFPRILSGEWRKNGNQLNSFLTYKNNQYQFQLGYPTSWKKDEINTRNAVTNYTEVVKFKTKNQESISAEISITIDDFTKPLNLEQYYSEVARKEIENSPEYQVTAAGTIMLAKQPAYQIVYSGKKLRRMQVFTLRGDNQAYIVTYTAEEHKYDDFLRDLELMIDSFEFIE